MGELARRFSENPLISPSDLVASDGRLEVIGSFNPGAFRFDKEVWLLVRVAERPVPVPGKVRVATLQGGCLEVIEIDADDPGLDLSDPREIRYQGVGYLSSLSHLRLFRSGDGRQFRPASFGALNGGGDLEAYGIEDARVCGFADGRFLITYTAVSQFGHGVALRVTRDFVGYDTAGMILPPANKDCAIFPRKIGGRYACLHRPSGVVVGGNYIWFSVSDDLTCWGGHRCVACTRPRSWDSARIGAGGEPIETEAGWLCLYHGADRENRYRIGALLLDLEHPWRVLARSETPLMEPQADYELNGFFGNVIFSAGQIVEGDRILFYYGASDERVCGAELSKAEVLASLGV
jgi:beta-1,2-mannobiose phosphorylase / 1,2-beta-oligomannan phosphorylase